MTIKTIYYNKNNTNLRNLIYFSSISKKKNVCLKLLEINCDQFAYIDTHGFC